MRSLVSVMRLSAVAAVSIILPAFADYFVALNGNDLWSGMLDAPNAAGTDGPFASVTRAQRAVREQKARTPDQAIIVQLRAGTHTLEESLRFTPEDSGTENAPVVFAAYPGEQPLISGGKRIKGWHVGEDGKWRVSLPDVKDGTWRFSQLFVNGTRRYRPRLPERGYYYIRNDMPPTEGAKGRGHDRFGFQAGDIRGDWTDLNRVEVLCFHQWGMSRLCIDTVDGTENVVTFTGPTSNKSYWAALPRGHRFLVENVREAMDAPGEWYLDEDTGELTYWPMPGETPETTDVIAPRVRHLITMRGQSNLGLSVEYIQFRGLTFSHSNWAVPAKGNSFPQAEANLLGALLATSTRHCVLQGCTFSHLAEYAVEWGEGCQHNRVEGCDLYDMAAGGIKIGTQGYSAVAANVAGHNIVRDNRIAFGGRMHPAAVGVWIGHSPHNVVQNNDIFDFYYTGISIGWQWGYAPSHMHHNSITHNHVHTIGQRILSDMGGIYTLGATPGTRIAFNCFHDIQSYSYGGWGIYFDQATTDILAEKNVVYRTKTGGFHQHFGKENRVVNNVFAFARTGQIQRTRAEEHRSFVFERNIVIWDEGPLLHGRWTDDGFTLDRNLYWQTKGEEVRFGKLSLDEWRAKGQDADSVVADPLFVDAENHDFRLRDGSPALELGFEPFDMAGVGCQVSASRPPVPASAPGFPEPPPEPPELPPLPVNESFEDAEVGAKAPHARTYEDQTVKTANVRVSDDTASDGRHSLKFTDAPGQKYTWDPHMAFEPKYKKGMIKASFDLRIEVGTKLYHEWRHYRQPKYREGPSLHIEADGRLRAGERWLGVLPHGQWVSFELACMIGENALGGYSLIVRIPGESEPIVREDLPCSPEFQQLSWFGFVSENNGPGTFYLDNVKILPPPE